MMQGFPEAEVIASNHHGGRSLTGEPWPADPRLLARFEPIELAELATATLMDRADTKYVLSLAQLPLALAALVDEYRMLQVEGVRLNRYRNLYYDTEDLLLYASHHADRAPRFKVRSRAYLGSGVAYLEVKRKTNKGRTIKSRMKTDGLLTRLEPDACRLVDEYTPLRADLLQPVLWNEFSRITLVSKCRSERVTFDVALGCGADGQYVSLDRLVIAEVKQQQARHRDSGVAAQLRALGIRPTRFSKYCVGVVTLHPGMKHNRFKPLLRKVHSTVRGHQNGR